MKRKMVLLAGILSANFFAQAQLVNDGAVIKIQAGAVLFIGGNVENKNAATISNDGKIEVQGNFLNTATYTSATADDSLIMSGSGNATLYAGASPISNLHIAKTTNADYVTISSSATITSKLLYTSGSFSTDPLVGNYSLNAALSIPFEFTPGREIIGTVRRTAWANGIETVFNQPNMRITTNTGTAPTEFAVTMIPGADGGDPSLNEREVKRKFLFGQLGGTGFSTNAKFPYTSAELNTNSEANLAPWSLPATTWLRNPMVTINRDAANDYVGLNGIPADSSFYEWKLADPQYSFNITAYIKGAWNNGTANMRTLLNTNGLLPLSQPYTTAPYNYNGTESVASIPNSNVVDWVLVEYRLPATGLPADATAASFVGRKAAFILNTGAIVNPDGVTPLSFELWKQGAGYFVIRHRNHLAVMSNSLPSNALGTFANNFSVLANSYAKPGALSAPATLLFTAAPGNTVYGMWPGDANRSGAVTSTDVSLVNAALTGPASGNTNVYSLRDITLDRNVTSADVSQTNGALTATAQTSTGKISIKSIQERVLKSHVPGEAH